MENIRSFIAIELPDELKQELSRLEAELKRAGGADFARWVDPYSIHLTLKFLGNIVRGRVSEVSQAMEAACQGIPQFQLRITELGAFPNLRRVQVVWVGVGGETERLSQLVGQLEAELRRLGFIPEARPFTPHLTLARIRDNAPLTSRQILGEHLDRTHPKLNSSINVSAISLMRSELTPAGAIYHKLYEVALDKESRV